MLTVPLGQELVGRQSCDVFVVLIVKLLTVIGVKFLEEYCDRPRHL